MAYMKQIAMSIREALEMELSKGFDTHDEFKEVMLEIAYEYGVTVNDVYSVYVQVIDEREYV